MSRYRIPGMGRVDPAKPVSFTFDGKRYAGEDTDVTTNVYALERLDLSDIERIEIVRGPSSSLYGSDAMGGVINIITKVPDKAGGTAGVGGGTSCLIPYPAACTTGS